jgi:hypothetical protein
MLRRLPILCASTLSVLLAAPLCAQSAAADSVIVPARPPARPLPPEAQSAGITHFSFMAYGDTRGRHDGTELQAEHELVVESMLETIKERAGTPDAIRFVIQSGDGVQNGSNPAQFQVSFIPLINRLTQAGGIPYFAAVGNHEVGGGRDTLDARRADGLRNWFATNARLIPPDGSARRLARHPDYAFGFGNTFFITFDSDIPEDTVQFTWVEKQLDQLDRRRFVNVVVFFHHPPFSSGPHGGATLQYQARVIRDKWMPLFRREHVRLLLTGHEHLFDHFVEHYRDASGPHRIDEIVSGGGGAPLYAYRGEPDLVDYVRSGAAAGVSVEHLVRPSIDPGGNPFHYVVIHVDGDRLSVEVVGVDWGRTFEPYRSNRSALSDSIP